MFLYLGEDTVIYKDDLIGIFDIENTTTDKDTRLFLSGAEERGSVKNVSFEMPKSFLICENRASQTETVFIAQISPQTLEKRYNQEKK